MREREKESENGRHKDKGRIRARLVEKKRIVVVTRGTFVTIIDDVLLHIFLLYIFFSFFLKLESFSSKLHANAAYDESHIRADYNFAIILRGTVERERMERETGRE